jgi:hypothetical protein
VKIPDNIYNWIESFFRGHMHCTRFGGQVSDFQKIMASIIQSSGIGPASYVVTASDLHPVTTGNSMHKYADDTYLVILAANVQSCAAEIANAKLWADVNNLKLNRTKSAEIVFVPRRSRRAPMVPPPAVEGVERVESIKALGVTISRCFSVVEHVDNLLAACAQTLFALRTLRQHGLPTNALQTVFQATVVVKLAYASPAWWGFASAADKARIESFHRRSVHFSYHADSAPTFASICAAADDKLFALIKSNSRHLLHPLLFVTVIFL